jgi:hypothetical protein
VLLQHVQKRRRLPVRQRHDHVCPHGDELQNVRWFPSGGNNAGNHRQTLHGPTVDPPGVLGANKSSPVVGLHSAGSMHHRPWRVHGPYP